MAALSIQQIGVAGLVPSYGAANAGGDTMAHASNARRFLHVKNGSGASVDVTIAKQQSSIRVPGVGAAVAISDIVVAVGAGAEKMIGPFSDAYRDASGNIEIGYSAATSVTVAALELPGI